MVTQTMVRNEQPSNISSMSLNNLASEDDPLLSQDLEKLPVYYPTPHQGYGTGWSRSVPGFEKTGSG